jgi:hypothetical protein
MDAFEKLIEWIWANCQIDEESKNAQESADIIQAAENEHKKLIESRERLLSSGKIKIKSVADYRGVCPIIFYPNGMIVPGVLNAQIKISPDNGTRLHLELSEFESNINTDDLKG